MQKSIRKIKQSDEAAANAEIWRDEKSGRTPERRTRYRASGILHCSIRNGSIVKVEKDYEDFVRLLNAQSVRYLLVGAYAVAHYAEPRNTGDIDFLINPTKQNAKRVLLF